MTITKPRVWVTDWREHPRTTRFRVEVRIHKEPDGFAGDQYMAYLPQLPGCVAFGSTPDGATELIKDSVVGVVERYLADGGTIPWLRAPLLPLGEMQRWIEVHVDDEATTSTSV